MQTLVRIRPRKLPVERRKPRASWRDEKRGWKRLLLRLRNDPRAIRLVVQLGFLALCVWIGVEFHQFMRWGLSQGEQPFAERPPGAEGFLPLSALVSIKHWILTGTLNRIHPAAVFILLAIVLISLVVKKAFCSFLCPVGTLSEHLWRLGRRIFGANLRLPRYIDLPLRSLKYLLLLFFLWSIATMPARAVELFVQSPYNKVADIKMYLFFAELSGVAAKVLVVLAVASLVVRNPWCRFLCPYGGLLGIIGWLSPIKIQRTQSSCIDCQLCTRACPSDIHVHQAGRVWSDECTNCLECVAVCPVKDTLDAKAFRKAISGRAIAACVVGIFLAVTGLAMATGHWKNGIDAHEYLVRFGRLDWPMYHHARGQVPDYGPTD